MSWAWRVTSALGLVLAAAAIFLAAVLFSKIQQEREANIRTNCLRVNDTQDQTKAKLDDVIFKLPPARRARAEAGQAYTVSLIETLAPKRDCEVVVRQQVSTP